MEKKKIPTKNYVIVVGFIVLIICACLATFALVRAIEENNLKTSPLSNKEVLYTDFKNSTKEMDADTFLVISYTRDKDVYKNEKAIKKALNKKNLLDNVTYLDVTEYRDSEDVIAVINKQLKLEGSLEVKVLPAVIFYKDGKAIKMVDSKSNLLNADAFEQIIDEQELAS